MSVESPREWHVATRQFVLLAFVVSWAVLVGGCGDGFDEGRAFELRNEARFEIDLVADALDLADEEVVAYRSSPARPGRPFHEPVESVSGRGRLTGVLTAANWDEAWLAVTDQLSSAGYRLPDGCGPPVGRPSGNEWDALFAQIDRQVALDVTIEQLAGEEFAVTAVIGIDLDQDLYRSSQGRCWHD